MTQYLDQEESIQTEVTWSSHSYKRRILKSLSCQARRNKQSANFDNEVLEPRHQAFWRELLSTSYIYIYHQQGAGNFYSESCHKRWHRVAKVDDLANPTASWKHQGRKEDQNAIKKEKSSMMDVNSKKWYLQVKQYNGRLFTFVEI